MDELEKRVTAHIIVNWVIEQGRKVLTVLPLPVATLFEPSSPLYLTAGSTGTQIGPKMVSPLHNLSVTGAAKLEVPIPFLTFSISFGAIWCACRGLHCPMPTSTVYNPFSMR